MALNRMSLSALLLALLAVNPIASGMALQTTDTARSAPIQGLLPAHALGASNFHKIKIDADQEQRRSTLMASGSVVERIDYGSFELFVVDEQLFGTRAELESSGFDFRDELDQVTLNGFVLNSRRPELTLEALDPSLRYPRPNSAVLPADAGLYVLQFVGPLQDEWLGAADSLGMRVVHSVSSNAFVVQLAPVSVGAFDAWAQSSRYVQYAGVLEPAFRIHPNLRALAETQPSEPVRVTVQIVSGARADEAQRELRFLADEIQSTRRVGEYINVVALLRPAYFGSLALSESVFQIEPRGEVQRLDEAQGQISAGNLLGSTPSGPGYLAWLASVGFDATQFGSFAINVADDSTSLLGHPDLDAGRVAFSLNPTGQGGPQGGHGFLNAHIVGGFNNGAGSAVEDASGYNYGLGIAPWARVGSTAIFGPGALNPTAFEDSAYASGSRISSNSWGFQGAFGSPIADYDANSQEYDRITRDAQPGVAGNQEYLVVFAAGNNGVGANTVSTPGTAKNVITVGASENWRPTGSDGCGISNIGADSVEDIISFSSRGPVNSAGGDGRWKPEIVAPGTHIEAGVPQSNYSGSSICNMYWPIGQTLYGWSSGTSHSTPAVAGGAALVRQWFLNQSMAAPSPAMVKAVLVNSADYMTGIGANDTLPSNSQGMGRMDLGRAFGNHSHVYVDQTSLLGASGAVHTVQGTITDPTQPLRVTLTWTDAPGSTIGAPWVNDLDLTVSIGATTYRGNVFAGATSQSGGLSDTRNNTESVFLPAGVTGNFTVRVTAASIAGDGVPNNADATDQDFALLVFNGTQQTGSVPPTAGFAGTPLSGTIPLDVSFSDQSSGAPTSWSWDFGDGGTSTLPSPTHTYTVGGTYTVSLIATNAAGSDTLTRVDYVSATGTGPPTGQGFALANNSSFTPDVRVFSTSGTLHMLVFDDLRDLTNPKKADWELRDPNGRNARGSLTPTASGSLSASLGLGGLPSSATAWTWTAFIETEGGDRFEYSAPITVIAGGALPVAAFAAAPTAGTLPLPVSFTDQSTGSPTSWSWNFGDGATSSLQSPSHTYSVAGSYTVALIATNATGSDTSTRVGLISVNDPPPSPPTAGFSATPTAGTAPLPVSFSDTSTGAPTSWLWNFGDGATSSLRNPSHTYTLGGTYTVALTATNAGGSDVNTQVGLISVNDPPPSPPTASFSATPTAGLNPLPVSFSDQSTGAPTAWFWNFGDGATSTVRNPSHTYTAAGIYTVALIASNVGGSDTSTRLGLINVTDPPPLTPPTANFSAAPTAGSVPLPVSFTDQSTGAPTSWFWSFGDGATSSLRNPSHTYTATGIYTVTMTATNALGGDPITRVDLINATDPPPPSPPTAGFGAAPTAGTVPLPVSFSDQSTGAPTSWLWNFGDGATSTLQNPSHTYTVAGTYTVALTATNVGGSDVNTQVGLISVNDPPPSPPTAGFSAAPTAGTVPLPVSFSDQSTGAPTSWLWNFGDGATSTLRNPSHTYTVGGTYTVVLTATNAGGSDVNIQVGLINATELPPPTADFSGTPTSGLAPLPVSFLDQTAGQPTSWLWNFGDGSTSTLKDPSHAYLAAGTYDVSLTATNAQGANLITKLGYVIVTEPPPPVGEDFVLSKNADHSTDDRVYVQADTLHMLAFSDVLDPLNIKKAQWEIRDSNGRNVRGDLTDNGDGTFTGSLPLSSLPTAATSWTWSAFVEDGNGTKFEPLAVITINP